MHHLKKIIRADHPSVREIRIYDSAADGSAAAVGLTGTRREIRHDGFVVAIREALAAEGLVIHRVGLYDRNDMTVGTVDLRRVSPDEECVLTRGGLVIERRRGDSDDATLRSRATEIGADEIWTASVFDDSVWRAAGPLATAHPHHGWITLS